MFKTIVLWFPAVGFSGGVQVAGLICFTGHLNDPDLEDQIMIPQMLLLFEWFESEQTAVNNTVDGWEIWQAPVEGQVAYLTIVKEFWCTPR